MAMHPESKTIAVVDDDPSMLKGVERLLNAHGFATKVFASAEEFLDGEGTTEFACLVLDIHLSGMSGIDLRYLLKASGSNLPVIFMTAFDDKATRGKAADAGCVAYLQKPFSARPLIDAIAGAVSGIASA